MSDLFDALHTLVIDDDLDLPPIPAAEIRARGDRLRRRRVALQALVTASVIAIVLWTVLYLIGGWSHGRG